MNTRPYSDEIAQRLSPADQPAQFAALFVTTVRELAEGSRALARGASVMKAYSVSRLARDAGVSVHIVRDYTVSGLLQPARRTDGGYNIYNPQALVRLRFVFEAGIGLPELTQLGHALDRRNGDASECLARLRSLLTARRATLASLDLQVAKMAGATRPRSAAKNSHAQPR